MQHAAGNCFNYQSVVHLVLWACMTCFEPFILVSKACIVKSCHKCAFSICMSEQQALDSACRHSSENLSWTLCSCEGCIELSCLQGVGLCHGIAGNAYGFLSLYRLTQDQLWLGRTQQFALFMAEHWQQLLPVPDEPFSLFEVSCLAPTRCPAKVSQGYST